MTAPGPNEADEVRRVSLSDAHDDYDDDAHPRPNKVEVDPFDEVRRERAELDRLARKYDLDNHHNAAMCPYCRPAAPPVRRRSDAGEERRAPVQGTWPDRVAGTVAWSEHAEAAVDYARRFPNGQDTEDLARRGGFDYGELTDHLGHEPRTWWPR